jgi:hypothetical protein
LNFENLPACCSFKNLPDCNQMGRTGTAPRIIENYFSYLKNFHTLTELHHIRLLTPNLLPELHQGLAFETLGPWCKETIDFINIIGDRLIAESGDSKSKKFLFERISLAIQRGNAASNRGTFPDSALLSEIFAL